jgi:hypothetical protein
VSRIETSGRISLRRPKHQIKGGSAAEEEGEEEEVYVSCVLKMVIYFFKM